MKHKSGVRGAPPLDTGRIGMRPEKDKRPKQYAADPSRPLPRAVLKPPDSVSAEWIKDFDSTSQGRALAEYENQLRADEELLHDLQWAEFEGRAWELFAEVLFAYGYEILRAWLMTGQIFAKCRAQGLRGLPEMSRPIPRQDADEIAYDVLGFAITAFRDRVLKAGRWRREGGASLKTFFIGQVLIQFVAIYKGWYRNTRREKPVEDRELHQVIESALVDPPEDTTVARLDIQRLIGTLSTTSRQLVHLKSLGYTDQEIAEILGLPSAKAVELRFYRLRRRLRGTA
ncbi:MAG: RNA polymerase sigma factor [Acidimicrobiia bacterium]